MIEKLAALALQIADLYTANTALEQQLAQATTRADTAEARVAELDKELAATPKRKPSTRSTK